MQAAAPLPAALEALCRDLGVAPPPQWVPAEGTARGLPIPWTGKLAAKLILARLPVPYRIWASLGLFRHGGAPEAGLRSAVFRHHAMLAAARGTGTLRRIVELGPGDSLASAIFAHAAGARATLIDAGDFATGDTRHYRAAAAACEAMETRRLVEAAPDRNAMLEALGARYDPRGLAALDAVPDESIDLLFSNAVLEHLPRAQFAAFFHGFARVLRPGALASHGIDLHDHLGGGLNHLRFAPGLWESRLFRTSGFYTNRLPFSTYVEAARAAGLEIEVPWLRLWESEPLAAAAMHVSQRAGRPGERRIAGFGLILRKPERTERHVR